MIEILQKSGNFVREKKTAACLRYVYEYNMMKQMIVHFVHMLQLS